ncbi:MAG: hypothetical protein S4CHLAM102_04840 [Chlamydiia bacterium]|nr:hypothetical protein [Chlamydiia bacterium]
MVDKIPRDLDDVQRLDPTKPVTPGVDTNESRDNHRTFGSYMNAPQQPTPAEQANKMSPMDLAKAGSQAASSPPSISQVQTQMNAASGSLGDLDKNLKTKNLKLKQSENYLLRNKLKSANGHIQSAAEKLGAEKTPQTKVSAKMSPIEKFLAMITDGQNQLAEATKKVAKISEKGTDMNPADLMVVQLKLQKAQQELDYSSIVLTKAIDNIKMLFQVQI